MIIEPSQNIYQAAIVSGHNAGYAFYLATHNNLNITSDVSPGIELKEPIIEKLDYLSFDELVRNTTKKQVQKFTINPNQSLLDAAIQNDGSALALVDWAFSNNKNPYDNILPGSKLEIIESTNRRKKLADFFKGQQTIIATVRQKPVTYLNWLLPGEFPF